MKVLLYLEAEKQLKKSGIGRAITHQMRALDIAGQSYTRNPNDDYDLVHINSYGPMSWHIMKKAQKQGKKSLCMGIQQRKTLEILCFFQSFVSSF